MNNFAIQNIIEVTACFLLIYGFTIEHKFVAFENKLAHCVAVSIRNHNRKKAYEKRRNCNGI